MLKTKKKFIKPLCSNPRSGKGKMMNCNGCIFISSFKNGKGYPCSQCKRNSRNSKRLVSDFYKASK